MTMSGVALNGVFHFEITVQDLKRSLGFYRDLIGFRVLQAGTTDQVFPNSDRLNIYEHPERVFRFAALDYGADPAPFGLSVAPTIVLLSPLGPAASGASIKVDQIGITHFGVWVKGLDAIVEQLEDHGVQLLEPPHTMVTLPHGTVRSAFTQDPDGIIVQLDEFIPAPAQEA